MDLADRLLEAHTDHVLNQLQGDAFVALVAREVDHLLTAAAAHTLDETVSRDSVKAVAVKYVAAFDLPGAIPETAGEIALRVREHAAGHDVAIGDVLGRAQVAAVLDKLAELRVVREQVVAALAASPSVQQGVADFLHSLATDTVAANRKIVERVPGMASTLAFGQRLAGAPLRQADQLGREVADRAAAALLGRLRSTVQGSVSDADVAAAFRDVWAGVADRPVSAVVGTLDPDDVVDGVVVGYDIWLELRTSPYLLSLVEAGVDYVFDTYGAFTLAELLEEFGLARADLVEEALRFAPRALAALTASGTLRAGIRRQLAGFYGSADAQAALAGE